MHGSPTRDVWELILLENCAYLVDDAARAATLEALRTQVGLAPAALIAASDEALEAALRGGGSIVEARVDKIRRCVAALEPIGLDALREAVAGDPRAARVMLKTFPGFGDPGVDKVLLLAGGHRSLAPESHALRVLVRLGVVEEGRTYAATYAASVEATADALDADPEVVATDRELLRRHGQELCRRATPRCEACVLRDLCPFTG